MKKKCLISFICGMLILSICGCGNKTTSNENDKNLLPHENNDYVYFWDNNPQILNNAVINDMGDTLNYYTDIEELDNGEYLLKIKNLKTGETYETTRESKEDIVMVDCYYKDKKLTWKDLENFDWNEYKKYLKKENYEYQTEIKDGDTYFLSPEDILK